MYCITLGQALKILTRTFCTVYHRLSPIKVKMVITQMLFHRFLYCKRCSLAHCKITATLVKVPINGSGRNMVTLFLENGQSQDTRVSKKTVKIIITTKRDPFSQFSFDKRCTFASLAHFQVLNYSDVAVSTHKWWRKMHCYLL